MEMILAKKIGMTRIFDKDGNTVPVSIMEAGPCVVTQVKSKDKDGYDAVQIGYGSLKHINKPAKGHLKKSQSDSRYLKEVKNSQDLKVGDKITVDIFKSDDIVSISGISKGKGYAGTVKRHHFTTGPKTHGSNNYRQPGSIGATYPQRVIKGRRMSGHLGYDEVSVKNVKVIDINSEKNLLLVKGPVPGAKDRLLVVRKG